LKKIDAHKSRESLQFSIHDGGAIVVFSSGRIGILKLFAEGDIGFIL
jgi:hypothetical protein